MSTSSSQSDKPEPRDVAYWAKPEKELRLSGMPAGAINLNVEGRQVVGPLQGFGQMWQKTYRVRLSGSRVTPTEVIQTWKENFPSFWPPGNNFYAAITSITPGEVAVLNLTMPGGVLLSTGVRVIYADDESFTFMTPEGHMFAAMITFSAYDEDGVTAAQVQPLLRANDPLYEIGMRLGFAHRMEDEFWHATLKALAAHFGVNGQVQQQSTLVDPRMQWGQAKNIWHNAAIRTTLNAPVRAVRKLFKR
jgi:hypothetical protein